LKGHTDRESERCCEGKKHQERVKLKSMCNVKEKKNKNLLLEELDG